MNSSPFYTSPDIEDEQTRRIFDNLESRNDVGDNVVFRVLKGWNDNLVIYDYDSDKGIRLRWMNLEHEKPGSPKSNLWSPLSDLETMVFGCDLKVVEGDRHILSMNVEQLRDRVFELVLDSKGKPAVIGTIQQKLCRLHHAYAIMKKGPMPQVDTLRLYGTAIKTGERVCEDLKE